MAGNAKLEAKLAALSEIEADPATHGEALSRFLRDKSSFVAAKAVDLVAGSHLADFADALPGIFEDFMRDGVKRDPGCEAKLAVVKALSMFSHADPAIYQTAVRYRQLEPAWGEPVDTAVNLRIEAGMALANLHDPGVLFEAANLLSEEEPKVRLGATEILEVCGGESAELMLRVKLLGGDKEAEVMAQCMAALMRIEPSRSLEFVAAFLDNEDESLAVGAALALGESRTPAALALLVDACESRIRPEDREALMLPIALTRLPGATEFLLDRLAGFGLAEAHTVLDACRIHAEDSALTQRIREAVRERGEEAALVEHYESIFGAFGSD